MTKTPNHEEIIELAKELYYRDAAKSGTENFNTPEISELSESGFLALAQTMLMRSEDTEYKQSVEEEARRLHLIREKKQGTFTVIYDLNQKKRTRTESTNIVLAKLFILCCFAVLLLHSLRGM